MTRLRSITNALLFFIVIATIVIVRNAENGTTENNVIVRNAEEVTINGGFTIVVLPDTQKYSESYPHVFTNQTKWIVSNKDRLNIVFVIHEGDIVQNWNDKAEWENANRSMSVLDEANVPYSVVPGNHEHKGYDTNASAKYYNRYFPVSRFSGRPWWGGNYTGNNNNYQLLTVGGIGYMFISLDFCPSQDEVAWANDTLATYPGRRAILATHGYLNQNAKRNVHRCGSTNYIWRNLIRQHENLQIVLSGHVSGESLRVDPNLAGKPVYQMLADYQGLDNGGNGWLRILEFVPAEDKIYVSTYSPYLNRYNTNTKSQFTLDYEMN